MWLGVPPGLPELMLSPGVCLPVFEGPLHSQLLHAEAPLLSWSPGLAALRSGSPFRGSGGAGGYNSRGALWAPSLTTGVMTCLPHGRV